MLERFLKWTAWEMTPPKAYGTFHLTFFLVGLAVCFLLAWLLRKTNERQNRAVLLTAGSFLLVCELYKQLFYYYVIGGGSYQWWIFPFQLCSIPMYFSIIAPLLPKGRVQDGLYNFMLVFNLMGGFIAFLEPSGLVHGYWTLTLHAFIWHIMLVFIGLYLGFSRRAATKKSDYLSSSLTLIGLAVIAFCINLIFWNAANGDINMFFVGPRNSPLVVFSDISARFGWYVCTPLYLCCLLVAGYIFFLPFYLWNKKHPVEEAATLANGDNAAA